MPLLLPNPKHPLTLENLIAERRRDASEVPLNRRARRMLAKRARAKPKPRPRRRK